VNYEHLRYERRGPVTIITINRPERMNAIGPQTHAELVDAWDRFRVDDDALVAILTGAGDRAFCAGADLSVLGTEGAALVAAGKEIAMLIRSAPKPVLAAVNGPAAGGGANLALACDYRLASDTATIGQVFRKLGLGLDWGGSFFLPRLAGVSKALELVWSARMVPAAEAAELGLFDRVVPHAELATETRKLAQLWAGMPPLAVRKTKELLYRSDSSSLTAMLDFEIEDQTALMRSR